MTILVDFNPVVISAISVMTSNDGLDERSIRHLCINMLLSYKNKFSADYGEMVITCDSKDSWRKDIYPYYKFSRKKSREDSPLDWPLIFSILNEIHEELMHYFPYKVIKIDKLEADDIIGVLSRYITANKTVGLWGDAEKVLIVSGDKDFNQLHDANIRQWTPKFKRFLVETNPSRFLAEHIIIGDKSDGVPNIKSPDDIFVLDKRQSPIHEKFLESVLSTGIVPEEYKENYERNRKMIDLSLIPDEYQQAIIAEYESIKPASRMKLMTYFTKKGLNQLYDKANQF